MTVPTLTAEQRASGYQRSLELRRARQTAKTAITLGRLTIGDVWEWAEVRGMKVADLLTALPGVGTARAQNILASAGIPSKNTVQACGPRQQERLFEAIRKYD